MIKRSKLCGRCHKTDIIDGASFISSNLKIARESPTKCLCVDCYSIVLEKYNLLNYKIYTNKLYIL